MILLLFDARDFPTPAPTAAPMTTTIRAIAIIQNILGVNPQIRRRCGGGGSIASLWDSRWGSVEFGPGEFGSILAYSNPA